MDERLHMMIICRKCQSFWGLISMWNMREGLVKLIYNVVFFVLECVYIVCCRRFLCFFMKEGVCYGGILVLLYVFVGLHSVWQIFNFWVCAICQRWFIMWKLMMFKIVKWIIMKIWSKSVKIIKINCRLQVWIISPLIRQYHKTSWNNNNNNSNLKFVKLIFFFGKKLN